MQPRFIQKTKFHGKGYMFRFGDYYEFILGSSNLTAAALSENDELNIRVTSSDQSKIIDDFLNEFTKFLWASLFTRN